MPLMRVSSIKLNYKKVSPSRTIDSLLLLLILSWFSFAPLDTLLILFCSSLYSLDSLLNRRREQTWFIMSSVYANRFEAVFLCTLPKGPLMSYTVAAKYIKKSKSFVKKWVERYKANKKHPVKVHVWGCFS